MPFKVGLLSPSTFLVGFKGANRLGRTESAITAKVRVEQWGRIESRISRKWFVARNKQVCMPDKMMPEVGDSFLGQWD